MARLRGRRAGRRTLIVVAVVTVGLALAAGIAYATIPDSNGVFTACKLNSTGTIRLIDPSLGSSSLLGHCTSLETQISWNEKGQAGPQGLQGPKGDKGDPGVNGTNGKDGVSVTSAAEPGGSNCAYGGSSFTAANGTTYACNGAPGPPGKDGTNGTNGKDGTSFTDISQLNGIACKTSGGSGGTITVNTSSSNDVTLQCTPPAPPPCTVLDHSTGINGLKYQDCSPLGTPGDPTTYTLFMAREALLAVGGTLGGGFVVSCNGNGLDSIYEATGNGIVTFTYAGSLAGHVNQSFTGSPICPGPSDPTWN
jgi:hypothetical protein